MEQPPVGQDIRDPDPETVSERASGNSSQGGERHHPSAPEPLPGLTGGRGRSEDQAICAPREEAADQPPQTVSAQGLALKGRESSTPTWRRAGAATPATSRLPPHGPTCTLRVMSTLEASHTDAENVWISPFPEKCLSPGRAENTFCQG